MSLNPQQLLRLTLYDCLQIPLPLCPLTLCSLHILQPTITSQTFRFPYLYVPCCYVPYPQFFSRFISPLISPVNFCLKRQKKRNFLTNIIGFSCCFLGLMFTGNVHLLVTYPSSNLKMIRLKNRIEGLEVIQASITLVIPLYATK